MTNEQADQLTQGDLIYFARIAYHTPEDYPLDHPPITWKIIPMHVYSVAGAGPPAEPWREVLACRALPVDADRTFGCDGEEVFRTRSEALDFVRVKIQQQVAALAKVSLDCVMEYLDARRKENQACTR